MATCSFLKWFFCVKFNIKLKAMKFLLKSTKSYASYLNSSFRSICQTHLKLQNLMHCCTRENSVAHEKLQHEFSWWENFSLPPENFADETLWKITDVNKLESFEAVAFCSFKIIFSIENIALRSLMQILIKLFFL